MYLKKNPATNPVGLGNLTPNSGHLSVDRLSYCNHEKTV
jgi:hypothetical protein